MSLSSRPSATHRRSSERISKGMAVIKFRRESKGGNIDEPGAKLISAKDQLGFGSRVMLE